MKILRIRDVTISTGLSRTTLWRLERRGDFPRHVRLSPNTTGWIESEVEKWISTRPRGGSSHCKEKESDVAQGTATADRGTGAP